MADLARAQTAGGSSATADIAAPRSRRDIVVFGAILIFLIAFPFIDQALGFNCWERSSRLASMPCSPWG